MVTTRYSDFARSNYVFDGMEDSEFHRHMSEIMTDLRDAHTRYLGPNTLRGVIAILPFLVERYVDEAGAHYLASKVFRGDPNQNNQFSHVGFTGGVELTHWNGIPIERAVDLYA